MGVIRNGLILNIVYRSNQKDFLMKSETKENVKDDSEIWGPEIMEDRKAFGKNKFGEKYEECSLVIANIFLMKQESHHGT